ncbi:uncharacterized protein FA14DRAFT_181037 [Meira miltonrushii]|uniref:Uncharacterized protein n=1 Tax=Meira miltonrushii TaxID=1280837 RepID=A0A316VG06_9BASI|nr:uncharacterized protein FA14DRAFT_181037 [Meira miltonrushii]PWN34415.1 hypothetical protein FA14DRAFT_181037 [Meira miltonrushii]
MKLFRALSVSALCFLTRHTCAAVPVFEDALPLVAEDDRTNRNSNFSRNRSTEWREKHERRMANYILQEVNNCRTLLPSDSGFLVHIDYSKTYLRPNQENTNEPRPSSMVQKRVLHKLVKTWKSMPTDQRLQAVGSLAGVLALPAFLTGAAQAWDAEQIQKIKQKAAEAEVAKHKGGKRKVVKESTSVMPPPPPSAFNHVKRDEIMVLLDEVQDDGGERKEQRGLGGTISKSMGHVHLPTVRPSASHAASRAASHAGSHMSTAMSRPVSSAPKQASAIKDPNPTVARVLSWTGAMTSLMYIPAAYQAIHKAQYVTDDDAHAYRRRGMDDEEEIPSDQLPLVTCIPVARKGLNYVIPEGALNSQNVLSSFSSSTPIYEDTVLGRRAESAALNKVGKHAKLVGIAGMGVGLGWLMHQLNQRRDQIDMDSERENMLTRRDDPDMDETEDLERRWKPGKGSVLTAAMFAGTALSASGLGVPQLHATVTEDPKAGNLKQRLQKRDQVVLQRRSLRHQLGRAATDKVTMFLATTATAYGAVKTGAASALYNAVVNPNQKANPPQPHVRRDEDSIDSLPDEDQPVLLDDDSCSENDCQFERRSGRKTTIFAAALLGTFLGQRTGKSGQEKENKQYLEQIGQGPPKQRRAVESNAFPDFVMQDGGLVKRAPGKNSEVAETASTAVKPYILPGAVAATTMAASFAGRKAVKNSSKKELDRRDMAPVLVKRGGKGGELGKAASNLVRQASKGKGPAIQHTVAETVSMTHINLGHHGGTPHVEAHHVNRGGGKYHAQQHSSSRHSGSGSNSGGSVQSKPHLERQGSTASSASSSPSSPHQGHHSPKHEPNEQVKQFYKDNPDVAIPSRVEEVHRIHHPAPSEHNGAHAQEGAKKKSSKGKKIAFAGVGAALGAFGHHQYTNAVDAKAQAAQQQAAQEPAPDAAAPPAKRSLEKRSPQGRRRRRGRGGGGGGGGNHGHGGSMTTFKMVHQHTFDHYLQPVGHQMKKGGGKKGAIGALVLGAVAGVVGHAIYHNSKANQAANQSPPVDAAEATAPQPPEPAKEENPPPAGGPAPPAPGPKKRSLDDQSGAVEKREAKGGKLASALTGGLVGMAVAGYGYAFTHDQPGTRKKHTVPVGTLPQNTEGATKAKKRSVNGTQWQEETLTAPVVEVELVSDEDNLYDTEDVKSEKRNMLAKYFNKMTPKQKIGGAIAGGIILSTAAAMVDPGAKEATRPITKREVGDEQLLEERGRYGKKDVAIVSAIAGVAGLTGLMKRDESMIEAIEEDEPIYQHIVERGNPRSFQNRAFAIADYATIALMGGTLIKNSVGALSSSKAHPKRDLVNASEAALLTRRDSSSLDGKTALLHPIDAEYQSFLSKRSTDEDAVEEDVEDVFDDVSGDTISRRTVKMMKLSGPMTHTLARKASHAAPAAAKAAHPSMDSLVGKMSMATIAGAITAPILKSVLGGSGSPAKGATPSPPPAKRDVAADVSMDKRAEYSKYIEAVKKEIAGKLEKRDISEPLDNRQELKLLKRKAADADYSKYIEAVKKEVAGKPKKRDILDALDGWQELKMVKRKAAAAEYGKYIEAVKKEVAGKLEKRDISEPLDGWEDLKMLRRKTATADYGKYIEAVKSSTEKKS